MASRMLGKKLFTKQTGDQGRICNDVSKQFYNYIYKLNLMQNLDKLFQKVNIPKAISRHMCSDTISEHMCSDTTFLSGQNPYNTL